MKVSTASLAALALAAASSIAPSARAQTPPVQGPPPGYQQQPPGYPPPGMPYYQGYPQQPLGPKVMDYEEGQPIPPGYRVESRMRKGMVIGGISAFGGFYLLSIVTGVLGNATQAAFGSDKEQFAPLYIPLAGPWITIGTTHANATGTFALAVLGAGQAVGAAFFIAGLASPVDKLVRNDVSKRKVQVLPLIANGSYGVGAIGRF